MSTFGPYPATVIAVHDADTLTVLADLGFSVRYQVDVRLYGCNAAELGTPGGDAAAVWLQRLLPAGSLVSILSHGWDKFGGRADCDVTTPVGDLTTYAVQLGWAAAWNGKGRKPVPPWPRP